MPKSKKNKFGASVGSRLGKDAAQVVFHHLFTYADALRDDHIREARTDQYGYTTFLGRQSPQERSSRWGHW